MNWNVGFFAAFFLTMNSAFAVSISPKKAVISIYPERAPIELTFDKIQFQDLRLCQWDTGFCPKTTVTALLGGEAYTLKRVNIPLGNPDKAEFFDLVLNHKITGAEITVNFGGESTPAKQIWLSFAGHGYSGVVVDWY